MELSPRTCNLGPSTYYLGGTFGQYSQCVRVSVNLSNDVSRYSTASLSLPHVGSVLSVTAVW